ncbi:MAG: hypothetical protein ACKOKF_01420 [Bacteroidota bacterium]
MSFGSGNDRLTSLVNEISVGRDTSQVDTSKYSASDTRIRIWRSAGEASLQHLPHGTGTGDVRQVLLEKYREKGYDDLFLKSYNAHNQFLQSSLALGMAGLLLLCAVFLFPILHFLKEGPIFGFQAVMAFALNCLTESLFEVQSGVIMYVCFLFLFLNKGGLKQLGK